MERETGPGRMSEDAFLAWVEGRDGRYELVEGTVVTHAGATRDHERVAKRIFALLYAQIDEGRSTSTRATSACGSGPAPGRAASCIRTW